ncbi:hypothetical protein HPB51_018982 [Rhipicephalus microplus]|uniref:Fibronectin type-III domain-containing protein n=1 Tax=Rhipicephalus microplus TaxID=6941 RepID=A0A9J6EBR2_RHIMP|nr:hypothetical protein HPB51_018982 [Rhipicephalus microplus]
MATSKERALALVTEVPRIYPEMPPPYPDVKETPPPYVQYVPAGSPPNRFGVVNSATSTTLQEGPEHKTTRLSRQTIVKYSLFTSLFVAIVIVAILLLLRLVKEKEYPVPPEVANLTLVAVDGDSFTATWERPEGRFDYYWIEVIDDHASSASSRSEPHRVGTCTNGTIIHPDQTQVTCGHIDACSNVSLNVRTHVNGPPGRTSAAVTLPGIFIPGTGKCAHQYPDPPKNITVAPESPSQSRLSWEAPKTYTGVLDRYEVKVCYTYESCDAAADVSTCRDFDTSDTSLHFESTVDTPYCVLITASARCGSQVLRSPTEASEIRTPSFAPGDFTISATAPSPRSVQVEVFVPEVKNGALDKCSGTIRSRRTEHEFSCNNHDDKSATVTLYELEPGTEYNVTVTFANIYDGREMATRKWTSVTTPYEPIERDWNQDTWNPPSRDRPYVAAGVAGPCTPEALLLCSAVILALRQLVFQQH